MSPDASRIRILVPTAVPADDEASVTFRLDRPVHGVRVGLRLDEAWQSYFTVVATWEELLRRDGAQPVRLVTGDRVGPHAKKTNEDLGEWAKLIECGVIGLGN